MKTQMIFRLFAVTLLLFVTGVINNAQCYAQAQKDTTVSKGYPDMDRDASWLLCRAKQIVKNARRVFRDGTEIWPPAGLEDFYHDRTYPRDFYYLVDACPECFTDSQLEKAIELFFKYQHEDGRIPNLVHLNGNAYYILHDNSQFLVNLVHLYVLGSPKQEPTQQKLDFFLKHADDLQRAMAWIPLDPQTGLVNGHYGFNDTIKALEGDLFTSLLYFEAAGKLKELYTKVHNQQRAEQWQKSQDKIKAAIQKLYNEQGFFYTSIDEENHLPFVWGSAFAVYIGATSEEQTHAIGVWLRDNYDKYIQRGQVRHFPKPLHWNNTTFPQETYQNGGYWATPFAWVNYSLRNVDPQLANQMLADIAKDFQRYGINEVVNFDVDYVNRAGHAGEYCASLAPLIIYRQLGANFNREYKNLALSSNGGKATASSILDDGRRDEHKVEHLNDGLFGNKRSWIASKSDKSPWFQIELAKQSQVDMIVFGRDNWSAKITAGHHPNHTGWNDRDIESFTIQVSSDGTNWSEPIHTDHSFAGLEAGQNYVIKLDKTISCKFVRMKFQPNTACIDEFEVFGQPSSEQSPFE